MVMESITLRDFNRQAGKAVIILLSFLIFSVFKIVKGTYNVDHIIISVVSILGIIGIRRLLILAERKVIADGILLKLWESFLLEQVLIFGIGVLCLYIFFVKGIYGFYLLFKEFDFKTLLYRLVIIAVSFQLVIAVSKIQSVFKSIISPRSP